MEEKYIATMLLHALGDTIGFKNGDWEFFNNTKYSASLEKLYEFIDLGGINDIDLKKWNVSDDTMLHMAIARSLLTKYSNIEELETNTIEQLIKSYDEIKSDKQNRYIGKAVDTHIKKLKNGDNWKDFPFDNLGGGNGSAMRNNCIGLAFWGEDNRKNLIKYSIESSMITHVNPIGWLGGLSTALFTAFILENISIKKWIPELLNIIKSEEVKQYLHSDTQNEMNAYELFIQVWKSYYEARFKNGEIIHNKSFTNLIQRLIFYNSLFEGNPMGKFGSSGYSAVIVAYDCLIDAEDKWEKLVIYSMLNNFDTDTIGAIAGGLYGTMYGLSKIPINNLKYIEFKDNLTKIGRLLYKKYYKKENLK